MEWCIEPRRLWAMLTNCWELSRCSSRLRGSKDQEARYAPAQYVRSQYCTKHNDDIPHMHRPPTVLSVICIRLSVNKRMNPSQGSRMLARPYNGQSTHRGGRKLPGQAHVLILSIAPLSDRLTQRLDPIGLS